MFKYLKLIGLLGTGSQVATIDDQLSSNDSEDEITSTTALSLERELASVFKAYNHSKWYEQEFDRKKHLSRCLLKFFVGLPIELMEMLCDSLV